MWEYRAALLNVHDGDTMRFLIDVGFDARVEDAIRLKGVFAPELSQPGGDDARNFVINLVQSAKVMTWPYLIRTEPNTTAEPIEKTSFSRYIGTVYFIDNQTTSLNDTIATFLAQHPEWGKGIGG